MSQEHLASVTGLRVRTITRIETTGKASPEPIQALAAVLEIDALALQAKKTLLHILCDI